ncbi:MAG TPA: PqqD family peptide modification chaperone [Burkholderiales bacterium]|jgi:multidrug resistance efflux pump|nr:PqqD family peptide modification chaperone [Burkholderiales bacterium]
MEAALAGAPGSPRFRSDLEVSEQRAGEATVFVLKEPSSGRIFRLPEVAYFIARQLDGQSAPEDIRRKVEEKYGDALSQEELDAYTTQLRRLGLLDGATQAPAAQATAARVRGDLLYLRFKAFDPDRHLEHLLPAFCWVFTRGFVAGSVALVLFAFAVAAVNWPELHAEFSRLYQFHALLLAWFVLMLTVCAHETAHGLTCKHFGGRVREMGFMLIYFQPALYCNVSDAWMFPEKAKRLWVTAAGAWLDIVLWSLAVLVWRITEPDVWTHFIALVVIATAGVRTLFNVNPLIKLDGYYFLSDALDIPNLRARASRFLGGLWRRLWGAEVSSVEHTSARERRIFLLYGLLAGAYSSTLLGTVAWWVGSRLVDRYQGLGFLCFAGLLSLFFRTRIKGGFSKLPERLRAGPGWFRSLRPPVKALIVVATLLAASFLIPATLTVTGEITVLPIENADVRAEVEGTISEIYVSEGDTVQAGAPIARLSDRENRAELNEKEAVIREKQAKLKQLRAGPRAENIAVSRQRVATTQTRVAQAEKRHAEADLLHKARLAGARAAVDKSRQQLKYAEQTLERVRPLVEQGFLPRARLEDAETEVSIRRKALEEAQAALQVVQADDLAESKQEIAMANAERLEEESGLRLLVAGTRPEDIEAMEAEIASLEARRDYLRDQIDRVLIRSPHAGVITTPRMEQKVGQHVVKGDLIAEVHERKQVMAEIAVREREIAPVRVGQTVVLKARAYPYTSFRGTVTRIAPATQVSEKAAASGVVRVTTVIDNPDQLLTTGMTGFAKIECGDQPLIAVPVRSLLGTISVEVWSWW